LSNRSKPLGGLRAAAGTLARLDGQRPPRVHSIGVAAAGLPENLAQARFILWLRSSGLEAKVEAGAQEAKARTSPRSSQLEAFRSLADALVSAEPNMPPPPMPAAIRDQFKDNNSPTMTMRSTW